MCVETTEDAVHEGPHCNPYIDSGCSLDHSGEAQPGALRSQIFVSCFKDTPTTGALQAASVPFLTQC